MVSLCRTASGGGGTLHSNECRIQSWVLGASGSRFCLASEQMRTISSPLCELCSSWAGVISPLVENYSRSLFFHCLDLKSKLYMKRGLQNCYLFIHSVNRDGAPSVDTPVYFPAVLDFTEETEMYKKDSVLWDLVIEGIEAW